jgi:alpha-beta hydrolase superfamily lysophospholipase
VYQIFYKALRYASDMIQKGFHFCSFDFAGCGNSGGEYVSLGWNERWDVLRLLENLKLRYQLSKYFIWGRSMGAVTAIKFYNLLLQEQRNDRFRDVVILGLILDSAFISLRQMAI